jgi:hypothetical protein
MKHNEENQQTSKLEIMLQIFLENSEPGNELAISLIRLINSCETFAEKQELLDELLSQDKSLILKSKQSENELAISIMRQMGLCKTSAEKQELLESARSRDKMKPCQIVTGAFLTELAKEDGLLTHYIFTNEDCLAVFDEELDQFHIHLLAICEKQASAIYKLISIRHQNQFLFNLFAIFSLGTQHYYDEAIAKNVRSHLASYHDTAVEGIEDRSAIDYYLEITRLIQGPAALENFQIICKSKRIAKYLVTHVLQNKLYYQNYEHISFDFLLSIANDRAEIFNPIFKQTYEHLYQKECQKIVRTLLPSIKDKFESCLETQLNYARILFIGFDVESKEGVEADPYLATELCKQALEVDEFNKEATELLLNFANAFRLGSYKKHKIKTDLKQARVIYQIISVRALETEARDNARQILHSPSFNLALGTKLQSKFDFENAYNLYASIKKPTPYAELAHLNNKKQRHFANEVLYYAQAIKSLKLLLVEALDLEKDYLVRFPFLALVIAQSCLDKKNYETAFKILIISKAFISEKHAALYNQLAYELAQRQIEMGNFKNACTLFSTIRDSRYKQKAENYLLFAKNQFIEMPHQEEEPKLSESEITSVQINFYEEAYMALLEALDSEKLAFDPVLYEETKHILQETINPLKQLYQQQRYLNDPTLPKNCWSAAEKKSLPKDLQEDIEQEPRVTLRGTSSPVTPSHNCMIYKRLEQFGALQPDTNAKKWVQNDNGEWERPSKSSNSI